MSLPRNAELVRQFVTGDHEIGIDIDDIERHRPNLDQRSGGASRNTGAGNVELFLYTVLKQPRVAVHTHAAFDEWAVNAAGNDAPDADLLHRIGHRQDGL